MIRSLKWLWWGLCLFILFGPILRLALVALQIEPDVWEHLRSHTLFASITTTLLFSVGAALVASVIGTGWALLSLLLSRQALLFTLVMGFLLAVPTYVFGFLGLSFLDYSGPVQKFLLSSTGGKLFFEPRTLGCGIVLYGLITSPYVFFSVQAGLRTQLRQLLEASVSLGSGFNRTVVKVLLPSLLPWILGGACLVALEATSDFAFVDLFALNTLSRVLYHSWGSLFSFAGAACIGLCLFAFCIAILFVSRGLQKKQVERTWSDLEDFRQLFPLTKAVRLGLWFLSGLGVLIFCLLPLYQLFSEVSHSHLWRELPWADALLSTLSLAFFAATIVGTMMCILFFLWSQSRRKRLLQIFTLGYGLPGTLLAVGFYHFASDFLSPRFLISGSHWLWLLIALLYFAKFGGLMLQGLLNQKEQLGNELSEAASLLASPARQFFRIELPLFSPALVLGFFLLVLEVAKELPGALMINPTSTPTLSVRIYQYASESDWARASVFSLTLIGLILFVILLQRGLEHFFRQRRDHVS